jgi:hypothetical protein
MKRLPNALHAVAVVCCVLLSPRALDAQFIPGNENDLQLANGMDIIYIYSDPSIGPSVGSSSFAANDFFWKVMSKDTLRHCSGTMEVTGLDIWNFDGDYIKMEGPNNTALADYFISKGDSVNPPVNPLQIEPDQADPNGVMISFGPGGPKNNSFFTNPGCPPFGYIYGFELDVDITGGAGIGAGITVTANGLEHLCLTTFIPGAGHTFSGFNLCGNGQGDGAMVDAHSSDVAGAIGETQFDVVGGGLYSAFGGYAQAGVLGGAEGVHEAAQNFLEFAEPVLAMVVSSATGQGLEEGLAGVHYNCPPGPGGSIGARLYAWQGLYGQPAAVVGTLGPPLPTCVKFKSSKLGLNPTDPLFNVFLGLWQDYVTQTDNGNPATLTPFDDGTATMANLPLPPQVIPVGITVPLSFQGFWKTATGVECSQVTRLFMHG